MTGLSINLELLKMWICNILCKSCTIRWFKKKTPSSKVLEKLILWSWSDSLELI